jgi:hypothetical protein
LALCSTVASAQAITEVLISRQQFGSGVQDLPIEDAVNAFPTADPGIFMVPSYMAGHPTAGTIYPRTVTVECDQRGTTLICDGYSWRPELGRSEYLFIRPVPKPKPPPLPEPLPPPEPQIIYVPYEVSVPVLAPPEAAPPTEKKILIPLPPKKHKVASCTPDGKVHWK